CHKCDNCAADLENYCPKNIVTYNGTYLDGTTTYGGYSDHMVANEHYVVRIPDNLPLDATAPLLCAGITMYSPLKYFGLDKPGRKTVAGSVTGGLKETQEMVNFAAKHNISADIEVIPIDYVNTAMERLAKADVRYRFVIDVANTLKAA
ncbi:cinnamyl-alcohol dehydrogenase, partial [Sarracenia purpurea var. burkii]